MNTSRAIAVSTSWNAPRHESGSQMVEELLDLGFDVIELSTHVTPGMIEEVSGLVKRGRVRVCSLHDYCPAAEGPSQPLLSAADESERAAAVALTKRTIEWAARLSAPTVVLHLGRIPMEMRQEQAVELMQAGSAEQARAIVVEDLMLRAAERRPHMDSVIASLVELSTAAEAAEVGLGLETRYHYAEIPSLDEFQMFFKNVPSQALGYWHDTGHAHAKEVLGVARQEDYLEKYGEKLIGVHVHDAEGGSDHRALGRGEIDFSRALSYVKPDTDVVLEVHGQASAREMVASRERVLRLLSEIEAAEAQCE